MYDSPLLDDPKNELSSKGAEMGNDLLGGRVFTDSFSPSQNKFSGFSNFYLMVKQSTGSKGIPCTLEICRFRRDGKMSSSSLD
jgi:hypothetical protein